jgi:hypothetical protein
VVGSIGLGARGSARAGFRVVVRDLNQDAVEAVLADGMAEAGEGMRVLVEAGGILITCLPKPRDRRGRLRCGRQAGAAACDCSTIGPNLATRLHDEPRAPLVDAAVAADRGGVLVRRPSTYCRTSRPFHRLDERVPTRGDGPRVACAGHVVDDMRGPCLLARTCRVPLGRHDGRRRADVCREGSSCTAERARKR